MTKSVNLSLLKTFLPEFKKLLPNCPQKLSDQSFVDAYFRVFSFIANTYSTNHFFLASPYSCLKRYDRSDKSDYDRFRYTAELPLILGYTYGVYCIISNVSFLFFRIIRLLLFYDFTRIPPKRKPAPFPYHSVNTSCLVVSHLNSPSDLDADDDFYFPGLAASLKSLNVRPAFIYTNKPSLDRSAEVLLSTRRDLLTAVIPSQLPVLIQVRIYLQLLINDALVLLHFLPTLFFHDAPPYSKRFLLVFLGSSRHSVSNLLLLYSLQSHIAFHRYDHIVFPFEGNSWESMLCVAARQSSQARLHAFCHTEVRPDFSFLNPVLSTQYSPDHFLVSHECFTVNLVSSYSCLNSASFSTVGFTSIYRSLSHRSPHSNPRATVENSSLIFCPDGFMSSSLAFIDLAVLYSKHSSCRCTVCLHPSVYDQISESLPDHPSIFILKGPLCSSLLSSHQALVFQTSTVALVAAYLAIPAIFFDPQCNTVSPLSYLLGSCHVARNVLELALVVNNLPISSSPPSGLMSYDPLVFAASIIRS